MIKFRFSLALLFAFAASIISFAHDFEVDGIYYNINDDGTSLSVTFRGDFSDSYEEYSGAVIIPSEVTYYGNTYSVTSIGGSAFYGCSGLTSVTIGNSVTSIGGSAFYGCSGLTSVTIGNSVTSISGSAFSSCSRLTKVEISDIAAWCKISFSGTYSNPLYYAKHIYLNGNEVTNLVIPNSVTSIGSYAFYNCSGLTSVTIPNSVNSIGYEAFKGCSSLKKSAYPDNLRNPFSNGTAIAYPSDGIIDDSGLIYDKNKNTIYFAPLSISSLSIPNSVTSIGGSAFYGCSGLTSITIPNSVTSIGYYAFRYCSGLTSVTIPNSVTSIADDAFLDTPFYNNMPNGLIYLGSVLYKYKGAMPNNSKIKIKDGTISISPRAFYGCTGLTSVTIPNSVTSIGVSAFYNCSGLTSITIPNSVTSIGYYAFSDCSGLTSVVYNAENCGDVGSGYDNWLYESNNIKSFTIGENVKTIPAYLCCGLSQLTSITIPNSVSSIGDGAFYKCSGLTSVTIPNSVTSIGYEAFEDCKGLTSVTIGNSVTSIGYEAFRSCSGLTSVVYNAENCGNLSGGGSHWLYNSNNIKSFTIGENVKTIPANLCYGLSQLTSITIPNSVNSIGDYAFYKCSGLTSVTIGNSVISIGRYAFSNCSGLTSVTIGNSVTSIGHKAFCFCSGLTSIQCDAATPPSLGYGVFENVDKTSCTLFVPDASIAAYKAADQWKDFLNIGGVEEIAIEESNISIENGKIINSNNENIEVYNLSGIKVYSGNKAEVELNSGVYIVVIGNKAVKIAL